MDATEAHWSQIFNAMAEGVIILDENGRIEMCNDPAERILGLTAERMSGISSMDPQWRTIHEDGSPFPGENHPAMITLRTGQSLTGVIMGLPKPDGTLTWISISSHAIFRNGKPRAVVAIFSDVSERKAAERALHQRNRYIETILEEAPIGFAVHTIDDGVGRFVSARYEEIYGVPRGAIDSHYTFFDKVWRHDPDFREQIRSRVVADMQSGDISRMHWENVPIRTATGETRYINAMNIPVLDQNLMVSTVQDVTERVRAEEALREKEDLFRLLEENVTDVIWAMDLTVPCFRYVSPSVEHLLGYTTEEIMRLDPRKVVAADSARFMSRAVSQRIDDYKLGLRQVYTDEIEQPCRNGSTVWVETTSRYVMNEQSGHLEVYGVSRNISERKRAQEELRLSQLLLRKSTQHFLTVAKCAPDTILSMDLAGRFTYVSPNIERTHGYTPEEALKLNRRDIVTPQQAAKGDLLFEEELKLAALPQYDRNRIVTFESEQLRKDGTTFWAEVNAGLIWSEQGIPVGVTCVVRDITERKRAEAEREKLWLQLSQAQKMESIGRLAGGIAHDFGNILSTTTLQIGLSIARPGLDSHTKRAFEELQTQTDRAANLTRQLLLFSRRTTLSMKLLDLNEVVANLMKMLGRLIGENISLRFESKQGLAKVNADAGMIEQVILNLAVNARDAMPKGGRLTISIESIDIGDEYAKARPHVSPGRFICLSLSDTGHGMDEETLKQIFEPFFTTKEPDKGTGLGLAMVHGIVGQHKGWVDAESEVGKGSTFKVFLPAVEGSVLDTEQSEKSAALRGNETILLVEDAAKLREMIAESLRLLGYHVIEAGDGQEAMRKWQEHHEQVDLLLSDFVLPGPLTGLELVEKFRESKPALKIILSSSYSAEMVDDGRLSSGNIAYLRKPYRIEEMSKVIRDCFGKSYI